MNLGKEEKEEEGGDEDKVNPECLSRRSLQFEPLWGAGCEPGPLYQWLTPKICERHFLAPPQVYTYIILYIKGLVE